MAAKTGGSQHSTIFEVLESRFPLMVEWTRQGVDSGGAGYNQGGLGMRRSIILTRGTASYFYYLMVQSCLLLVSSRASLELQ
ncbi:MAG: hypothetical protein CM15mP62_28460 [Rhodospirillaceae bacterium]|nr:MAG: hypothetical protein CM15mP62_28460 [Rhodospirillaceae bacterium]